MGAQQVNDADFEQEVLKADVPVLVDFWAEWCGPCRALGPSVDALASEKGAALKVVKVNIDDNPNAPTKYGVRSIPTLLIFKNGEVVAQTVGSMAKSDLVKWVDGAI
ncbi:MAG: thioredoxin [Bdellovibrionales bacterium]|jgi:thioredoxin 1|nr:thioredoxin [Bdellovibrionales bacterium]